MNGIDIIAAERKRHDGRWSPEHDDSHTDGSLVVMAAIVAVKGTDATVVDPVARVTEDDSDTWGIIQKHKGNRIRQLAIAGSLIAAEIDRQLRLEYIRR